MARRIQHRFACPGDGMEQVAVWVAVATSSPLSYVSSLSRRNKGPAVTYVFCASYCRACSRLLRPLRFRMGDTLHCGSLQPADWITAGHGVDVVEPRRAGKTAWSCFRWSRTGMEASDIRQNRQVPGSERRFRGLTWPEHPPKRHGLWPDRLGEVEQQAIWRWPKCLIPRKMKALRLPPSESQSGRKVRMSAHILPLGCPSANVWQIWR